MPRRMGSPFAFGQAVVEPTVQPLFDRVTVLAAGPNVEHRFFTDLGAPKVRGLDFYSGITQGGQLSAPRLAVTYGIRLVASEVVAIDTNILPDLKLLLYGSHFRWHVGVKDYLECPSFYLPAGVGITGFAAADGNAAATNFQTAQSGAPVFLSRFSVQKRKVATPPQQGFFALLQGDTIAGMGSNRNVWCFLDGEFALEVQ